MEAATQNISGEMFGFFELDEDGIVRYSSPRIGTGEGGSLIGRNFFEFAACRNSDDLRRHFRRFVERNEAANSFTFDCFFDRSTVRTKVTMTHAFQTEDFPPKRIVMLDIREIG
jgi:hypothetical protein